MKAGTNRRTISRRIEPPPFAFDRLGSLLIVTATMMETDDTVLNQTGTAPASTVGAMSSRPVCD